MRPYGLQLDQPSPEHFVFGGTGNLPQDIIQPDGDWTPYLPVKELQNLNGVEPYACVTYSLLNCVETLIFRKFGETVNYSDRFLAAISGTKQGGNSPQVVCEFLRTMGVVVESLWPFSPDIQTFNDYYSPISDDLKSLALEFVKKWDFKHEFVIPDPSHITNALKCSPLLITIYAWVKLDSNLYYKPEGATDNHAIMMFYELDGQFRRIFDSYDSPNIKNIEWKSMPMIVKRIHIEKKVSQETSGTFWSVIRDLIIRFLKDILK